MHEALSPLADPHRPGGWYYIAHRRIDRAQKAIDDKRAELAKNYPDADFSADIYTVEKIWKD